MSGPLNVIFIGNFCLPKFRDNLSVPPEDGTDVLFRNVGQKNFAPCKRRCTLLDIYLNKYCH